MRVLNFTQEPTSHFRKLAKFVRKYTQYDHMCVLEVYNTLRRKFSGGGATYCMYRQRDPSAAEPSLIRIWRGNCTTPYKTLRVKKLGKVTVNTRDEEFVFILAHEMKHLDDFWGGRGWKNKNSEYSAEQFAIQILKKYRLMQNAKCAKLA